MKRASNRILLAAALAASGCGGLVEGTLEVKATDDRAALVVTFTRADGKSTVSGVYLHILTSDLDINASGKIGEGDWCSPLPANRQTSFTIIDGVRPGSSVRVVAHAYSPPEAEDVNGTKVTPPEPAETERCTGPAIADAYWAEPTLDAGVRADANTSAEPDASVDGGVVDSGAADPEDAGESPDAGQADDAGAEEDAAVEEDAGHAPDASEAPDATEPDASAEPDAGVMPDAGHETDAGEEPDAG